MNQNALKLLVVLIVTVVASSCGMNPNFTVEGNCIVAPGIKWIGSFDLEVLETGHWYSITRNYELDGNNKVCFDQLPNAYVIKKYSDTISSQSIDFSEGQTIKICMSGGCRTEICKKFAFKSGELILKERRTPRFERITIIDK